MDYSEDSAVDRAEVFYGREATLKVLLERRAVRTESEYEVICGPPGIGKSALSRQLLSHLREREAYEELIELDARDWSEAAEVALPEALSLALGFGWRGSSAPLMNVLAEPTARLILIENAERCDESALSELLEDYARRAPQARFLVLTRSVEAPWRERASAIRHELGPLGSQDDPARARELFVHHARRAFAPDEMERLDQLLALIAYHPFSIELCAALSRWTGLKHVLDHVRAIIDQDASSQARPLRHLWSSSELKRLFWHSWSSLEAQTQAALREFALFDMPVATTTLATCLGHRFPLPEVLEDAARHGLISVRDLSGHSTVMMAHVFRLFCLDRLSHHPAQRVEAIEAISLALVHRHERVPVQVALLDDLAALDAAKADTRLIRRLCREGAETTSAEVLVRLARICLVVHVMQESWLIVGAELRPIALRHDGDTPAITLQRVLLLTELALEELTRELDTETLAQLEKLDEQLLLHPKELESRRMQWRVATQIVWARSLRGEYEQAARRLEIMEARRARLESEGIVIEPEVRACLKMRQASLLLQRGQIERALEAHEQAFHFAQHAGDQRSWAMVAHNLAVLYSDLSRLEDAKRCLNWAMTHKRYLGVSFNAINELSLGLLHMRSEEHAEARACLERARGKVIQGGLHGNLALIDINMASVELDAGDLAAARPYIVRALEQSRGQDEHVWVHAKLLEANCAIVERRDQETLSIAELMLEQHLGMEAHELPLRVCFLGMKMIAELALNDVLSAQRSWRRARELYEELPQDSSLAPLLAYMESFLLLEQHQSAPPKLEPQRLIAWLTHEAALASSVPAKHESLRLMRRLLSARAPRPLVPLLETLWRGAGQLHRLWIISSDGALSRAPDGAWIDLRAHELLAQLVSVLGHAHRADVTSARSLEELEAALWPQEKILPQAATNRLHVSLSRLRRRGFDALIVREEDGYRLDPDAQVIWADGLKA